jgi:pyruvate,orthophosphate dikinase
MECNGCLFAGLPDVIHLLDPPLHEFLLEGDVDEIVSKLSEATRVDAEEVLSHIKKLLEVNPMLGFRGCW